MAGKKLFGYYITDMINPKKWWWIIQVKLLKTFVSFEYCEKVVYASIVCSECVEEGKCIDCKCPIPDKMMTPKGYCSLNKWDNRRSDADWRKFKEKNGIKFNIEYS